MDAFVRLTDPYDRPCYIRAKSVDAFEITTNTDSTEVLIAGHPDSKYIVEESPDVIHKLIQEAETANIHKIDEIEDDRARIMREQANELH